ncbi:hypothetical protein J6590_034815 [Homalodisca vitripennis]|nr:hypothetical protein J6590_034815 [Homalodisca vitripennis]
MENLLFAAHGLGVVQILEIAYVKCLAEVLSHRIGDARDFGASESGDYSHHQPQIQVDRGHRARDRSFRLPGERFYGIFECGRGDRVIGRSRVWRGEAPIFVVSRPTKLISLRKPVSSQEYYNHAGPARARLQLLKYLPHLNHTAVTLLATISPTLWTATLRYAGAGAGAPSLSRPARDPAHWAHHRYTVKVATSSPITSPNYQFNRSQIRNVPFRNKNYSP